MSSTGACTCPQAIAIENHKEKTCKWWQDKTYRKLADDFLKEHKTCEYCGKKSTLVHHDDAGSYRSQEEYYKPENFTPCCARCHHQYRIGYVICPVCRQHYMKPGKEMCRWCRGMPTSGRPFTYNYKRKQRHPCAHRIANQRCQRGGRCYVCSWSSKKATGCEHFLKKEALP